ncbi:hypothetical protein ILYODFUR_020933, partial [Ilyodon furcidens]
MTGHRDGLLLQHGSLWRPLKAAAWPLYGDNRLTAAGVSSQSAEAPGSNMASRQRNSVRILSSRERGSQTFGSQRLLQLLVEEKVRWMKWQSQKVELPDSPRSTFLLAFSPD